MRPIKASAKSRSCISASIKSVLLFSLDRTRSISFFIFRSLEVPWRVWSPLPEGVVQHWLRAGSGASVSGRTRAQIKIRDVMIESSLFGERGRRVWREVAAGSLGCNGSTEHVHAADVVERVCHAVGNIDAHRLVERQRATLIECRDQNLLRAGLIGLARNNQSERLPARHFRPGRLESTVSHCEPDQLRPGRGLLFLIAARRCDHGDQSEKDQCESHENLLESG